MNIYDFDKTIYDGDSTADFYFRCLRKYPKILFTVPAMLWALILYFIGLRSKTQFKEIMYRFLLYVPDIDSEVESFWDVHHDRLKDYYRDTKKADDIVISASPEFLLEPISKRLGFGKLIASRVDKHTGKYTGENCWGQEKVNRLYDECGISECEAFYSDSLSDTPLANIAKQAYIVKGQELIDWKEYETDKKVKLKKMFFSKEFIMFLIVGGINTINGVLFSMLYGAIIKNANIAFAVGYITSTVISYILNSFLTFKERLSPVKYVKFFISYIPNFIIQNLVVIVVYNIMGMNKLIAYILAAIIGVPVTFILMKIFAFRKRP